MNDFFLLVDREAKRQAQQSAPDMIDRTHWLTLDLVRKDWYRQGIDPDLVTKVWDQATDDDKRGSLAAFQEKFYDMQIGRLRRIGDEASPSMTAEQAASLLADRIDAHAAAAKRKPGRPKKVGA